MKSTGIRRKVDDLGRIVIPAGIRKSLSIREGDAVDVSVDGETVVLTKPHDTCIFCGGVDELAPYRSRLVCRVCVAALGAMDGERRAADRAVAEFDTSGEREEPRPWSGAPRPTAPPTAPSVTAPELPPWPVKARREVDDEAPPRRHPDSTTAW